MGLEAEDSEPKKRLYQELEDAKCREKKLKEQLVRDLVGGGSAAVFVNLELFEFGLAVRC